MAMMIMRSPDGDPAGGAPAGGAPPGSAPPAAPPAAAPPAAGNEPANPSHRDWNGLNVTMRAVVDGLKVQGEALAKLAGAPAAKPEPATTGNAAVDTAVAEVAGLRAYLTLTTALLDAEIKGAQREALTLMWQGAGRPVDGIADWVTKHRAMLGPVSAIASPPAPVIPPIAPSDAGAPVSTHVGDGRPTGHPLSWPLDMVGKMKPGEYRAAIQEFEKGAGGSPAMEFFDKRAAAAEERRAASRKR